MGNQISDNEDTNDNVENCPPELNIDIVVESFKDIVNSGEQSSENIKEDRKQKLQRLHYMVTTLNIGDPDIELVLDEFRDWPITKKYNNREVIILCELIEFIINKSNATFSKYSPNYHLITELINDIIRRTPYIKTTGEKSIVTTFKSLVRLHMYDHANQILFSLVHYSESYKNVPKTLLRDMAFVSLNCTGKISSTYIVPIVMLYITSVNWETTEDLTDLSQLGWLISSARLVKNKNLLKTLLDIVDYDIPVYRKTEDIIDALFTISESFTPQEIRDFLILDQIENLMTKESFTHRAVVVFSYYFDKYKDTYLTVKHKDLFYSLVKSFVTVYLPEITANKWPDNVPLPDWTSILHSVHLMYSNTKEDIDLFGKAIITIVKESIVNIDRSKLQMELKRIACAELAIPIIKVLYDAHLYNDIFCELLISLVMFQDSYIKNENLKFIEECLESIFKLTDKKQLVHIFFHIVTKKSEIFGAFTQKVFIHLHDNWNMLVENQYMNRLFLIELNELLVDRAAIQKYTPLIKKANEFTEISEIN
jgi:hypothetical protein